MVVTRTAVPGGAAVVVVVVPTPGRVVVVTPVVVVVVPPGTANVLGTPGGKVVLVVLVGMITTVLMPQSGHVVVVVVLEVVVVLVVVVGGGGPPGQSSGDGSGWPSSKAMATERPCSSLKKAPMVTKFLRALILTLIGLSPVWRRSSVPGVPAYLQTNTFGSESRGKASPGTPHAPRMTRAATPRSQFRIHTSCQGPPGESRTAKSAKKCLRVFRKGG